MTNLFDPLPFELKSEEINVINKMEDKIIYSNWTDNGKMKEKGRETEQLVSDILYLFDDIKVRKSEKSSVLDEVFKIDFIIETLSDPLDVFAFQVKSSLTGAIEHHLKNGEQIAWKGNCIRTPWVLIVDGSLSNFDLFNLIADELCLSHSIDQDRLDKLKEISLLIIQDNNKRRSIKEINEKFGILSKRELKALRLFFKISRNAYTFYLKNK